MSLDVNGRLRFRVRKLKQAPDLLNRMIREECSTTRHSRTLAASDMELAVHSTYDVYKVYRAIAKTLVNYAVDTLAESVIRDNLFRPVRDFCLGRIGDPLGAPFVGEIEKPTGVAAIDSCPPERHALALCSNKVRLVGLVRLYGGPTYRVHLGAVPIRTKPFQIATWIDYNGPGRIPVGK